MSRAGFVMLGAGVVGEQNSLVNETHLLTLWYLWCIVVVVKKSRGRVGSRTFIQDQVGVAKRQGFGAADVATLRKMLNVPYCRLSRNISFVEVGDVLISFVW